MVEYAYIKHEGGITYIRDTENVWTSLSDVLAVAAHAENHEDGGSDEIDLTGLDGSGLDGVATDSELTEQSLIITTIASSATPTPTRASKKTELEVTAQAADAEFGAPSGTPVNGDLLFISVTDNGTPRALTYNAIYDDPYSAELPTTTTANLTILMLFRYSSARSKWELIFTDEEA